MPCAFPQAYAEALLVIPKVLAQNSGHDPQESIVKLQVCVLQPWPSVRPFIGTFFPKYQLVCDDTRRRCHLICSHPSPSMANRRSSQLQRCLLGLTSQVARHCPRRTRAFGTTIVSRSSSSILGEHRCRTGQGHICLANLLHVL